MKGEPAADSMQDSMHRHSIPRSRASLASLRLPGKALGCSFDGSFDGSYGQVAKFMSFDKVVLIAGGSGATFTFLLPRALLGNVRL